MSFKFKKILSSQTSNTVDGDKENKDQLKRSNSRSFSIRMCHLKKSHYEQYGFNLRSKKDNDCHYIGLVDKNTAAYLAGLKKDDRIITINNRNIDSFKYEQIVELIKYGLCRNGEIFKNELLLTVADKEADEFYTKLN